MLLGQAQPSTDGWQPRSTEAVQPPVFTNQRSMTQASKKPSDAVDSRFAIPHSQLETPQRSAPTLNWIPSGQIPASPWDRSQPPAARIEPSSQLKRQNPTSTANESAREVGHERQRTIHQPTSASSVSFPVSSQFTTIPNHFITQPQNGNPQWEQIPENGKSLQLNAEQPIVDLGWPIPADSMVIARPSDDPSPSSALPLEAHRDEPSGASQGARRASRTTEPTRNELGKAETTVDQLSTTPGSVVGIVTVPLPSTASVRSDDRSMRAGMPSTPYSSSRVVPASIAEDESVIARTRLASQVSRELLSDSQQPLGMTPAPVEPPAGWKSIEQELRDRMAKCDELLRKNAVLSARDEALTGLRVLFRAIDLRSGDWLSEPALDQALAAFAEESEFQYSLLNPTRAPSTARIVAGHSTQALKQVDLNGVSPELAAQHYRSYARQQLVKASQGHPWAADLIYALGKTYERRAETGIDEAVMLRNQAVACFSAALEVMPNHADGANQLGYALLKLDRVDEAQSVLSQATQSYPSAEAWRNLAEVYRRRGQLDQAAFAIEQATSFGKPPQEQGVPDVVQIDPKTFAGMSPNQFMNQGTASSPPVTTASAANVPVKNSSWFSRLLR